MFSNSTIDDMVVLEIYFVSFFRRLIKMNLHGMIEIEHVAFLLKDSDEERSLEL